MLPSKLVKSDMITSSKNLYRILQNFHVNVQKAIEMSRAASQPTANNSF